MITSWLKILIQVFKFDGIKAKCFISAIKKIAIPQIHESTKSKDHREIPSICFLLIKYCYGPLCNILSMLERKHSR